MDVFQHARLHLPRWKVLGAAAVGGAPDFSQSPHGRVAGPAGLWEHVIVAISVIVLLVCLYLAVRYFIAPREREEGHIKRKILDDEARGDRGDDA